MPVSFAVIRPMVRLTPVVLFVLCRASVAHAHHVVGELGVAPVLPQTVLSLEVGGASFDVGHTRGAWESLTPQVEWNLARRFSLFAALPVARVTIDGAASAMGAGDLSVSGKVLLFETPHGGLLLSAGLGIELPTGSASRHLGSGHAELTPFALLSSALASAGPVELLLHGQLAPRITLGGSTHAGGGHDHSHAHGSLLAPHADRELAGRMMLAVAAPMAGIYFAAGASAAIPSDGSNPFVAPALETGLALERGLRLSLAAETAVAGERRFGTRGRASVGWRF